MRIISGSAKGRIITLHKSVKIRPTSDRVRETLFNILGSEIDGSIFLDCFAGSGAVGLEAASRGADKVISIEKDGSLCKLIERNFKSVCLDKRLFLIQLDYLNGLKAVNRDFTRIDFAFFDPPYYSGIYEELLNNLIQIDCLENSRIIIEHYKKIQISPPPSLEILRTSKIGDTHLTFIKIK